MANTTKGKYYYIPGYHRLVYCHEVEGKRMILSGLCEFINDSKTSITRQSITTSAFYKLKAIELDIDKLETYPFLTKYRIPSHLVYGVVPKSQRSSQYIRTAQILPSIESSFYL